MACRPSLTDVVSNLTEILRFKPREQHTDTTDIDLNISFEPSPDYPGIATAAGGAWGATVKTQNELDPAIQEAINVVQRGRCAVIEVA